MKYKYSKLARKICTGLSWECLIDYQAKFNFCTGKTAGAILGLISEAMLNPETYFDIRSKLKVTEQQFNAIGGIQDHLKTIISKLQFDFIFIEGYTIVYKPYGYVTRDWMIVDETN